MKAGFHKTFDKQFSKLSKTKQDHVKRAILLFLTEANHSSLRNHPLKRKWQTYHSISAGGDLRLHYRIIDTDTVLSVAVGTHAQLYR